MALEVASEHSFDLVLSDLGLPDGSGLDLMREMRKRHGLPGVAISGYGMEDDLRQTREAGFIAHLTKPLSFNQLQAVLTQFATTQRLDLDIAEKDMTVSASNEPNGVDVTPQQSSNAKS
jgi:CheY-like chemotaxis protein